MEDAKAKELLSAERSRVEGLLKDLSAEGTADRDAADEPGDMYDSAEPLTTEGTDDAIRKGSKNGWTPLRGRSNVWRRAPTGSPCGAGTQFPMIASKPIRRPN